MSQVHKADRNESRFMVADHAIILKNMVRELSILRNFGYKARESKIPRNFYEWSEASRERWKEQEEARLKKLEWLDKHFLVEARKSIEDDIRKLQGKVKSGRVPMEDMINMVRSWTRARSECMSYQQLHAIEETVLSIYGREAYEQVYDHSERWKAT